MKPFNSTIQYWYALFVHLVSYVFVYQPCNIGPREPKYLVFEWDNETD
jgi:hypothetical protein